MRLILLLICALTAAPASAQWVEASTPRIRVFATSESQARAIAERIERLDAGMRLLRSLPEHDLGPASRLTIYIVNSSSRISRFAGPNVAGFYSPRVTGSVAFVPSRNATAASMLSAEAVLFHEYAHHFMFRNSTGAYPAWFSEGYAEFFATAKVERDGALVLGNAPGYRAAGILEGQQLPIRRLLDPGTARMTPDQLDNLYGRGWMLTHMLTFSPTRPKQLARYLDGMQQGKGSLAAAEAAFGDLAELDRELSRYAGKRLTGLRIPPAKLKLPPIAIRHLSPGENAVMDVHIESTSGVNTAEAKRLLPRARRIAAAHRGDAFVQGVLAEAEYDAGNYAAARDAALGTLTIDPKSRQGMVYHGMALRRLAETANDTSPATWRAVIAPWLRANRQDPDDPLPPVLIYGAAMQFGQRNPNIVKGLLYAETVATEDRGVRMMAAGEYLEQGDVARARPMIASLAYDPHAGMRDRLAPVLARLDADDPKGALAALRQEGKDEEATGGKKDGAGDAGDDGRPPAPGKADADTKRE